MLSAPNDNPIALAKHIADQLTARLECAVRGRREAIELIVAALLADGHVLLEDYPGSGKTTLAKALGESFNTTTSDKLATFRRIQFTPDLLPSDITGTTIFDVNTQRFIFRPGPVFAHVVLADEINRTSPKVQSALLEAMAEKQVTIDNETHALDQLFFVIATQNPLDIAGTYPLPTPQLDRFLFKIKMHHIARDAELEVLNQYPAIGLEQLVGQDKLNVSDVLKARETIRKDVAISGAIKVGLVEIAQFMRTDPRIAQGASTRSLVLLLPAMQARAVMHGRNFVAPDDLKALAPYVFTHRLESTSAADDVQAVIREATDRAVEVMLKEGAQSA